MSLLHKFNTTFQNMADDLVNTFPDDTEFPLYQLALKGMLMADETMLQRMFHDQVTMKYESMIMDRDEQFFLRQDFCQKDGDWAQTYQLITKLKNCWLTLTDENKDTIWKYFKVLVLLDKKIDAEMNNSI